MAALAGRWDEVIRLAEHESYLETEIDSRLQLDRAEALGALGHLDEALTAVEGVEPGGGREALRADVVHAAIDLRRDAPRTAAERLTRSADKIERDGRRLAIGMHVAALLAVAAHDLAQDETAAVLFGYAAAEQDRLDIALRPSHRPMAEDAIAGSRAALGPEMFAELAAQGANTEWRDLPAVDLDTP